LTIKSKTRDPRAEYAIGVLVRTARLPGFLCYGRDCVHEGGPNVQIVSSDFFGTTYGTAASLPKPPLPELEGVPILFGEPRVERQGHTLVVHADLVASTYFLLTRYEEWIRRDVRDAHGRFPGKQSLPYRAGFIDRPVVDEYAALLRKWAREVGIDIPEPKRQFSVLLTHDVDSTNMPRGPIQAARSLASGMLRRRPWPAAFQAAGASLGLCRDPLDNIDEVIALDEQLTKGPFPKACKSIYFFMAGGRTQFDRCCDVRSTRARRWIEKVKASGAQIGLHASYEAGEHPELVARERCVLEEAAGQPITMNRHHYLRWREPAHGHDLAKAGINWDSTLGYPDVAGFRLGACTPVPLFDPDKQCLIGIEEHPLIIMDRTLSDKEGMDLDDEDAAFDYVRRLIDVTYRHRGELVLLWHNTALSSIYHTYHHRLYSRILQHVADLGETVLDNFPERSDCS